MADSKLAAEVGTQYARLLYATLPEIEKAFGKGSRKASFTVKAQFQVAKNGDTEVTLTQTASIPMEVTNIKLNFTSGQMRLFEGEPTNEEA